jgi:hypothetical protein
MKLVHRSLARNGPGSAKVSPLPLPSPTPPSLCSLFHRPGLAPGGIVLVRLLICSPPCVQLLPEEEDDLWHAYNLIAVGDTLQAVTVRWVFRLRGARLDLGSSSRVLN